MLARVHQACLSLDLAVFKQTASMLMTLASLSQRVEYLLVIEKAGNMAEHIKGALSQRALTPLLSILILDIAMAAADLADVLGIDAPGLYSLCVQVKLDFGNLCRSPIFQ